MSIQKKQNHYTSEFKETAVKLAIENDQSVSKTADELGVNPNTLHTWIRNYRGPPSIRLAMSTMNTSMTS